MGRRKGSGGRRKNGKEREEEKGKRKDGREKETPQSINKDRTLLVTCF